MSEPFGYDDEMMREEEACFGCGDGDKVPAVLPDGYWRCPVCDAEWHEHDEASLPR
ncbi:MAG: hypothetical protein Q7T61_00815 [Caulobacter sp.]|nr:hypothetical protein [Caulobacter sp.]